MTSIAICPRVVVFFFSSLLSYQLYKLRATNDNQKEEHNIVV